MAAAAVIAATAAAAYSSESSPGSTKKQGNGSTPSSKGGGGGGGGAKHRNDGYREAGVEEEQRQGNKGIIRQNTNTWTRSILHAASFGLYRSASQAVAPTQDEEEPPDGLEGVARAVKVNSLINRFVSNSTDAADIGSEKTGLDHQQLSNVGKEHRGYALLSARNGGKATGGYVVNPYSKAYARWSTWTAFLALLYAIIGPGKMAFCTSADGAWHERSWVHFLTFFIDMNFLLDVGINFILAYEINANFVIEQNKIARRYITSFQFWLVDFISFVPLVVDLANGSKKLGLLKLIFLVRFVRLHRVGKTLTQLEKDVRVDYTLVTVVKLIGLILLTAHMSGCILYLLAKEDDYSENTWIGSNEPTLPDRSMMERYVTSLYWALTTMTTVGYGDLSPHSLSERTFACFALIGYMGLSAYTLGNITLLTTKADSQTAEHRNRMKEIYEYMETRNIPEDIERAALASCQLSWELSMFRDDALEHCPPSIRLRVMRHLYREYLTDSYLFAGVSNQFLDAIIGSLEIEFFIKGTFVLTEGAVPEAMYVILDGSVTRIKNGELMDKIGRGKIVGEEAMICDFAQYTSFRTDGVSRIAAIPRPIFKGIAAKFRRDANRCQENIAMDLKRECAKYSKTKDKPGTYGKLSKARWEMCNYKLSMVEDGIQRSEQDVVTSLLFTALRGDASEVKHLIEGTGKSPDICDYDGRRAIHIASASGNLAVVQVIVELGGDVNVMDNFGSCAMRDALKNERLDVADYLFSKGASLNLEDPGGMLCSIASKGDLSELELMLKYGVFADSADYDGRTALHLAAAEGFPPLVKLLLRYGASINAKDRWGHTPYSEAEVHGHPAILQLFSDHEAANLTVEVNEVEIQSTPRDPTSVIS